MDVKCENCQYAIWSNLWGEYKCDKKKRACTESEVIMGCSDYKQVGSKPDEPTPEIIVRSGATFTPNVSDDGLLSWTNDKGLVNPKPVNLKPKDGYTPVKGKDYTDGYTPVKGKDYFDGKDGYTPIKGVDYFDGEPGKDGYTPVKGVDYFDGAPGKDGKDGYTPVKGKDYFDGQPGKDGVDGAPGKDGKDGKDGVDGKDGYSPVKGVDYFDGAPGKDGVDGRTPVKGTDYFTDADKAEMVQSVLSALPNAEGVGF